MARPLRYVVNADGETVSELDVEIPEAGEPHDPRRSRRWQSRPVEDPDPTTPTQERDQ